MALTAALAATSSLIGGMSEMSAANYQAAIARKNAKIAENNSNLATDAAAENAMQSDIQLRDILGQQSAIQGASGLTGRTQELVRAATHSVGRQDALNITKDGETQARNFLQESADYKNEASALKRKGQMAMVGGVLGAVTGAIGADNSLLGSAKGTLSNVGQKFNTWNSVKQRFLSYKGKKI